MDDVACMTCRDLTPRTPPQGATSTRSCWAVSTSPEPSHGARADPGQHPVAALRGWGRLQGAEAGQPVFLVVWRDGLEVFVTMTKR